MMSSMMEEEEGSWSSWSLSQSSEMMLRDQCRSCYWTQLGEAEDAGGEEDSMMMWSLELRRTLEES